MDRWQPEINFLSLVLISNMNILFNFFCKKCGVVNEYAVGIKNVRFIGYPIKDSNGAKRAKASV
jgi:hypothetical protein